MNTIQCLRPGLEPGLLDLEMSALTMIPWCLPISSMIQASESWYQWLYSIYKLLGVYISNDLRWTHHVENIVKNGNERFSSLRVFKQCGAPPASLAKVDTIVGRPALEYAAPVWQNIPDFLYYKIESIQKRAMRIIFPLMNHNEALNALNLTTLCERRAHLCQVYIDRLRNENHPLHLLLPKWEEFVHNYNLRSGVSCITCPSCRTKRTQEFVPYKYI